MKKTEELGEELYVFVTCDLDFTPQRIRDGHTLKTFLSFYRSVYPYSHRTLSMVSKRTSTSDYLQISPLDIFLYNVIETPGGCCLFWLLNAVIHGQTYRRYKSFHNCPGDVTVAA